VVDDELVVIDVSSIRPDLNADAMRMEDLAALAAIPGVKAVSSINQIPYGGNVWASSVATTPEQADDSGITITEYMDDGRLMGTFGLRLVAGRAFEAEEYRDRSATESATSETDSVPVVILGNTLAKHLFPDESAVGKEIYESANRPMRVVGVVEDLLAPGAGFTGIQGDYFTMILPLRVSSGTYAIRTEPARRGEVLKAAEQVLERVDPNRIFDRRQTLEEMRYAFYSRDRAVVWLLLAVCVALLAVTALGIVGMASFWVQQRTKQIGVRRALGATRAQVLAYFQTENFILATAGIALGMLLAFGINQMLMSHYELPRLPWQYLPVCALVLWSLGQIAVLGPARRAASVPPATATRSA
jgi:putative ABC transport system permease protein